MEPVSVVIPTYNRAKLLPRTLASVVAATADVDEIIIVDDGSTDNTAAVVDTANAPWYGRVHYLPVKNGGAGRARNTGVAVARHDLIAFADSDDVWLPHRLALQRQPMESNRALAFFFSDFGQLFDDGRIVPHWIAHWSGDTRNWDAILAPGCRYAERWPLPATLPPADAVARVYVGSMYVQELHANYINVNTLLVRRSVVGDALHFAVDLPVHEDWECFARITRAGNCAYLDVDTALQCSHSGPRLTQTGNFESAKARITLIERTWVRDADFMQAHGHEVAAVLAGLRRTMLRQLIRLNQRDEARALLAQLDGAWLERLALRVPHAVLKAVGKGV
ncbi:MAG: glycosyltransferase family 2 protein [Burkholderiales bacterium]